MERDSEVEELHHRIHSSGYLSIVPGSITHTEQTTTRQTGNRMVGVVINLVRPIIHSDMWNAEHKIFVVWLLLMPLTILFHYLS